MDVASEVLLSLTCELDIKLKFNQSTSSLWTVERCVCVHA